MKRGDIMARKSKPLTPLQQEYRKQRRRIQQFIRRAEKRGYQFSENVIPDKPKKITKGSVERLRKLTPEKLYKKSVYGGEATYGEIVKGTKGIQLERKKSAEKALETKKARQALRQRIPQETQKPLDLNVDIDYTYDVEDFTDTAQQEEPIYDEQENRYYPTEDVTFFDRVVLENFQMQIQQMNEMASNILSNFYGRIVNQYGEHEVAQMLQNASEAGVVLQQKDTYDHSKVTEYVNELLDYLPEAGDFTRAEIMEALEFDEAYEPPV